MFISCTRLLLRNRHTGIIIELITTAPSTDSEHSKHTFCFPNPGLAHVTMKDMGLMDWTQGKHGIYGLDMNCFTQHHRTHYGTLL